MSEPDVKPITEQQRALAAALDASSRAVRDAKKALREALATLEKARQIEAAHKRALGQQD